MNESVLRAFVAIYPNQEVVSQLRHQCDMLQKELPEKLLRWLPSKNWHITLKFLGNINNIQLEFLDKNLSLWLEDQRAVHIQLTSITWFPNRKKANVLAAIAKDNCTLDSLAERVNTLASRQNIMVEKNPFRPHLSLARCRHKPPLTLPFTFPLAIGPIAFKAQQIHLVQSQTFPRGAIYTKLASYSLLT